MLQPKKTGSTVCPGCGRLVSVTAPRCMHCGRKNPGLWGWGPVINKYFGNNSMVAILLPVCVALYVLALLMDISSIFKMRSILGLLSPSNLALFRLGATGSIPMQIGRWWTVITAIYLHGSILHILFNMLWLRDLGRSVEQIFGTARGFLIFTISGALGFIVSNLVGLQFTIGASGSVFGLLGALLFYGKKSGHSMMHQQLLRWAIIMFVLGFLMPGINNLAHLGGFVGGYGSAMLLGFEGYKKETQSHKIAALLTIGLTIFCFVLVILNAGKF